MVKTKSIKLKNFQYSQNPITESFEVKIDMSLLDRIRFLVHGHSCICTFKIPDLMNRRIRRYEER